MVVRQPVARGKGSFDRLDLNDITTLAYQAGRHIEYYGARSLSIKEECQKEVEHKMTSRYEGI